MLILSRKKAEKIVINGNIIITVIEVRGDKVRLGFDAPKDVRVDRAEIHERRLNDEVRTDEHQSPMPVE